MDYIFYQVAAVNGFDSVGHYLRAGLMVNQCATYAIEPVAGCSANFPAASGSTSSLKANTSAVDSVGDDPVLKAHGDRAGARARPAGRGGQEQERRKKGSEEVQAAPQPGPRVTRADADADRGGRAGRARGAAGRRSGRPGGRPRRRSCARPTPTPTPTPTADPSSALLDYLFGGRRMRSRGSGIAGNPVLIGAATVLVILVAVFLSYNANSGPAVRADLPGRRGDARAPPSSSSATTSRSAARASARSPRSSRRRSTTAA